MKKITIIVTVPVVLETWFKGQPNFLSKHYEVEIITSPSKTIESIQKYENVSIKTFDFNRKIDPFKDIKVLIQLFLYLKNSKPDIVYTLTPKAGLLGMISAWMAKVPIRVHNIVGLPHLEAKSIRKFILTTTEKLTYIFATKLYCNSLNLKQVIQSMTKKEVDVIANGSVNGVDTNYFLDTLNDDTKKSVLDKLYIDKNDFVVTFVGRIVNDKGINELVEVFTELSLKYKNIKLLLIGDYKDELDSISAKSMQLIDKNDSIIYLEFQEDIREYLAITNLFVLPSYREGLPNVLIEAGSYGIPLIATNINGCNEIIEDNINGMLVEKKNKQELKNGIEKFFTDKEYYNSIKKRVRASIIERYDQEIFWKELLKKFKSLESVK